MKALLNVAFVGLVQLLVIGALFFIPAGTLSYWQAWLVVVVFVVTAFVPSLYLQVTSPAAMERRMRSGPTAEGRTAQKIVMVGLYLSLAGACIVSALDHRYHWSSPPIAVCLVGVGLVAAGLGTTVLVVKQNNYASTTIQVEADQQVISTGLYGHVRHPMYTANTLILTGLPLALGSYWGLIFLVPGILVLISRIRDEEKLLVEELPGYRSYTQQVRHRLVPGMW
ncbi:methyltransferase family protein [Mycolicibacterium sp. ELW1]|uniref:methyltransferase family protein n=1 Tax=Mycobacteriaceae TaxID=1762 RepID=UPI0011EEA7F5|nr:isoprenylcysteine carboxylmethyltransferase family protein [Mycobacterium sp. ELW1]QEN17090.1 isoprenylcysteine carboxylmethyltransferase family protein [Mycobacterium sp. ELW1]